MCVCFDLVCWAQQTHRHFPTHIRHLGLGLHHVTHFATIVFYLLVKRTTIGRAWVSFWIMSHRSLKKNEFFERRRMALGINSICTMFTPFRNEQRAFVHEIHEQRNFYEHREFVQKHELGYVRVEHVREMISRYHVLPRARIPTSCVQGSVI